MRGPNRGPVARPAEAALDREQPVEQLRGSQLGLDGGGGVQEPRLVDDPDRIGLAEGRDGDDLDPGLGGELLDAPPAASPRGRRDSRRGRRRRGSCPGARRSRPTTRPAIPAGRGLRTRTRARADGEALDERLGDGGGERLDQSRTRPESETSWTRAATWR